MKENSLVQEYADIYSRIRELVNDDEVYPQINPEKFHELVSYSKWIPVTSFDDTLKQVKESDKGHITFRIKDNKLIADLIFHKTPSVKRLINITQTVSKKEYDSFAELIKRLNKRYCIELQYATKIARSRPEWKTIKVFRCEDLNELKIKDIFNSINDLIEMRATNQKTLPKLTNATISVAVGRIEIDYPPKDEELKETFTNLAKLIRITHNLKSNKEINKLEEMIEKQKQVIKEKEEHLNKIRPLSSSVKEFSEEKIKWLEKELEKEGEKLKELEEGKTSEHKRDDDGDIEEDED